MTSPPLRLYQQALRAGVWDPHALEFSADISQWDTLSPAEREPLVRLTFLFHAGEEGMTRDAAAPAAPRPKEEFPGAVPEDGKLNSLLRQCIRPTNDDATVDKLFKDIEKEIVRGAILKTGARIDGRDTKTVRPIKIRTGVLPRTHGSALFTRGETQALVVTTLGTGRDAQIIDALVQAYSATPSQVREIQAYAVDHKSIDDIPLNDGCLRPLRIIVPPGSMLAPEPPAAVVAGNVETSQAITGALYAALGVQAEGSGTMNNVTQDRFVSGALLVASVVV